MKKDELEHHLKSRARNIDNEHKKNKRYIRNTIARIEKRRRQLRARKK